MNVYMFVLVLYNIKISYVCQCDDKINPEAYGTLRGCGMGLLWLCGLSYDELGHL